MVLKEEIHIGNSKALLNTVNESMENQKQLLDQKIEAWREVDQVDDIVIFGVEVD